MKQRQLPRFPLRIFLAGLFFLSPLLSPAQQSPTQHSQSRMVMPQSGIYLVFPFENVGASAKLDWIGEGLEELTIQRLSMAGQQVDSHAGRLSEMDRSGLPPSGKLSRATMLHIAQELDADYVVFGNYSSDGRNLTVSARLLRVSPVALLPVVEESDSLSSFMDMHARLTWKILKSSDHNYPLSLAAFSALQRPPSLAAFEQYIRGLLANDDETKLRDLKEAARLEPDWPE